MSATECHRSHVSRGPFWPVPAFPSLHAPRIGTRGELSVCRAWARAKRGAWAGWSTRGRLEMVAATFSLVAEGGTHGGRHGSRARGLISRQGGRVARRGRSREEQIGCSSGAAIGVHMRCCATRRRRTAPLVWQESGDCDLGDTEKLFASHRAVSCRLSAPRRPAQDFGPRRPNAGATRGKDCRSSEL
jgi:hypothetical protein